MDIIGENDDRLESYSYSSLHDAQVSRVTVLHHLTGLSNIHYSFKADILVVAPAPSLNLLEVL